MKKFSKILFVALLISFLSGCFEGKDAVTSKSIPLVNLSSDYEISDKNVNIYFINNDESTPYVDIRSFVSDLSGFFEKGVIHYYRDLIQGSFNLSSTGATAYFNWEKDEISVTNMDLFYYIVKSSSTTNYSSYLKAYSYETEGKEKVTFKLSDYGYKVVKSDTETLIPLVVANVLFCSPNYLNLFYRGDKLFSYVGEIYYNDPEYQTIFGNVTNSSSIGLRESTINSLCFVMDYFYGLKEDKNITSFRDYIPSDLMDGLKSTVAADNRNAYKSLLVNRLDDLHTRVDSVGFYYPNKNENPYTRADLGDFGTRYYSTRDTLSNLRSSTFSGNLDAVRFSGDTAIITLDSFTTGTNEQIFDSTGKVKSDAWKYDSYWYMQACMDIIDAHGGINDILLDISLNGGGNLGALMRVFGFITDSFYEDYNYDTLTHEKSCYKYLIDTNRDNYYNDHDSYDNYRWTLLSGINTFSAANALITKVKQVNAAKVIGKQSGGGMCSVLPTVLQDGAAIAISSQNTIRLYEDGLYKSTEYGHAPDLTIQEADFYNDEKLVEYIDQVYGN